MKAKFYFPIKGKFPKGNFFEQENISLICGRFRNGIETKVLLQQEFLLKKRLPQIGKNKFGTAFNKKKGIPSTDGLFQAQE